MAIAIVQAATYTWAGASSVTGSFANMPTQDNLLIATGRSGENPYTSGDISGWTLAVGVDLGNGNSQGLWYKVAGASESKDVVLTWTGSTDTRIIIAEYGGFTGTPTLDQIASVADTGVAVSSRSSGTTPTTTANDELCLAVIGEAASGSTGHTWSNSFSLEYANNPWWFLGSRIVAATGTYETTLSWSTQNRKAGGLIATFYGVVTTSWIPKIIMVD